MHALSTGVIQQIYLAENQQENPEATVQVLNIKKISSPGNGPDRFRIVVSDGVHYMQAMLTTQLNDLVTTDVLLKNGIVRLKKIIIILNLDVLTPRDSSIQKIGNPIVCDSEAPVKAEPTPQVTYQPPVQQSAPAPAPVVQPKPNLPMAATTPVKPEVGAVFLIKNLNPYQNRWTIRARVITKSDIRTWTNQRGSGKLFSCTFADESGEIRATTFNEGVDSFYDLLQENQVYYVSRGQIKVANKQYSSVQNDYEMTLDQNSVIQVCNEPCKIPEIQFNALELNRLFEVPKDASIDIIAVVKENSPCTEFTSKAQKVLKKRELTIVDGSGWGTRLTLWGKQAETFEYYDSPIIVVKGAKVSEFNGRTLSVATSSTLMVNPDIPEAHRLRGWYDACGATTNFQSYSGSVATGQKSTPVKTILEVQGLPASEKGDWFILRAYISFIKNENPWYPACPQEGCNKKVTDMGGSWRCEKCDMAFPRPNYRYIMTMNVADFSGQTWLSCFDDVAQLILGKDANELHDLAEYNKQEYDAYFNDKLFKEFKFKVRAKAEMYQDDTKMRMTIMEADQVEPVSGSHELLALLK